MGKKTKNNVKLEKKEKRLQKKEQQNKPSTICLNMIVKNEAHIIEELFNTLTKYIDYYVISDTGSTDGTQEKIKNYFDKIGIPGEVHQNTWVCPHPEINYFDFGYNRSIALDLCKGKCDYIWIIDADDLVVGDFPIKSRRLTADSYKLKYGNSFTYTRHQIFKNDPKFNWHYCAKLHEYISSDIKYGTELLDGDYYIDSRRLGNRSQDPQKYLKDAKVFEWEIAQDPSNTRNWFYGAQSYKDAGKEYYEKAIKMYKRRAAMGDFFEEVFYSKVMIGTLMSELNKYPWKTIENAYLDAYKYLPIRGAEAIYSIVVHYREINDFETAYNFAKKVEDCKYPSNCCIFIEKTIYDYRLLYELIMCSYYTGRYQETIKLCQKLIKKSDIVPELFITDVQRILDLAKESFDIQKLLKNPENDNSSSNSNVSTIADHIKTINDLKSASKYMDAYKYCQNILDTNKIKDREIIEKLRDSNIDYFKDTFIVYPADKISRLKPNPNGKKIILTMTTCKRFDLFEKTVNSFINCCNDISHIDHWLCVDDNSSEEDRQKMQEQYPFFEFVFKDETQKGHYISMNIIYNKACNYDYVLHMEDDWHFVNKYNYITNALQIFKENEQYGQVLFNRSYCEIDFNKHQIAQGKIMETKKGLRYILHEYYPSGSHEYHEYMKRQKYGSCAYWPHFSFRPSLIKCSALKEIGVFYNTPHFEMAYAKEYVARNYKSTFFDGFFCIHIGKKTWEKNTDKSNAYDLNKTDQFTMNDNKLSINVITEAKNIDKWKKFKESANNKLPFYIRHLVRHVTSLDNYEKQLFLGNTFNYQREIINDIMAHIDILKTSRSEYKIVLMDDCTIFDDFNQKLKQIINDNMSGYDIISLENFTNKETFQIEPMTNYCYELIHNGYIINKSAIEKLLSNLTSKQIVKKDDIFESLRIGIVSQSLITSVSLMIDEDDNSDNNSDIVVPNDYVFYSNMDSFGSDIICVGNDHSIDDLISFANSYENCVAFNTLGYLKYSVCEEKDFIYLPNSEKSIHGLYVKKNKSV